MTPSTNKNVEELRERMPVVHHNKIPSFTISTASKAEEICYSIYWSSEYVLCMMVVGLFIVCYMNRIESTFPMKRDKAQIVHTAKFL